MKLMPEIRCGLHLLFFLKNNIDGFVGSKIPIFPLLICFMKIFAALSVEVVNTSIIVEADSVSKVIMEFIALEIIS